MKKAISLLLALVMCLSLCACDGGSTAPETTVPPTEAPTEPTAPVDVTIHLNETFAVGDYEITVTDYLFVPHWNPNGNSIDSTSDGSVKFLVFWSVKNIGKTEIRTPDHTISLTYADGYVFNAEETYHLSTATGAWVANADELPVLSEAVSCQTCFEVPQQVHAKEEDPLSIIFSGFNDDTRSYILNVRPADEIQKTAILSYADQLISSEKPADIAKAVEYLMIIKDDAEATAMLKKTLEACQQYIQPKIDDNSISYLNGEYTQSLFSRMWKYYDGTRFWSFYEAKDKTNPAIDWRVEEDHLILTIDGTEYV